MQGLGYLHELWDKVPIVTHKSQETLDLSYIVWDQPLLIHLYLTFISGYSFGRDYISQIGNLLSDQLKLGWLETNSGLLQLLEHSLYPLKVAGQIFREDDNIIQIDDTPIEVKVPKASLH